MTGLIRKALEDHIVAVAELRAIRTRPFLEGSLLSEAWCKINVAEQAARAALSSPSSYADGIEAAAKAVEQFIYFRGSPGSIHVTAKLSDVLAAIRSLASAPGERGSIVAWLRANADGDELLDARRGWRFAADCIDRGDHLRTPGEGG